MCLRVGEVEASCLGRRGRFPRSVPTSPALRSGAARRAVGSVGGRLLAAQRGRDVIDDAAKRAAQSREGCEQNDGNAADNQRVLDEGLPLLVVTHVPDKGLERSDYESLD